MNIVLEDIQRKQNNYVLVNRFFNRVVKIGMQHGTIAVLFFRFGNYCYRAKLPFRCLLIVLYLLLKPFVNGFTGVKIRPNQSIAGGFVIHNFSDITIDAESIGKNLTVNQGVYIGRSYENNGKPTLGNNVFVGAGAKILGNIAIGDNVIIAANASVSRDIASNCMVAGVPAMVISRNMSDDYVGNVKAHSR